MKKKIKVKKKRQKKPLIQTPKQKIPPKNKLKSFIFRQFKPAHKLGSGGVLPKTKALGRLIRWPKYVKLQRQKKILFQRLKIPPAINIFSETCSKTYAKSLVELFSKYMPESKKQKKERLAAWAKAKAEGKSLRTEKPIIVRYGFNTVTNLIEAGRAKLVLIAHDVDPIELVLWMPALCAKKDVPFAIIKSKSRLGTLVRKKTATCVALCDVLPGDKANFETAISQARKLYNDRLSDLRKKFGSRVLGVKTRHRIEKRSRLRQEEAQRRKKAQAAKKEEKAKGKGKADGKKTTKKGKA